MRAFLLAALASVPFITASAQSSAVYQLTFASTWSAATHPEGFPSNPHFSPLVGATHNGNGTIWEIGGLASGGMESMAEIGATSALLAEVSALQSAGVAQNPLSGGAIGLSPGSVQVTINLTEAFPEVTLVSMLAPSPDWFVGVAGLVLFENDAWIPEVTVPLYVYDAGTDSGANYGSPDQNMSPAAPIARIEAAPFLVDGTLRQVGTFQFVLQSTTTTAPGPSGSLRLSPARPNPARDHVGFELTLPEPAIVRVRVFDMIGREVAALEDGSRAAGTHSIRLDARAFRTGVYVLRAEIQGESVQQRFVVR